MLKQKRSRVIFFTAITFLSMIILAAGISQINLKAGKPVNLGDMSIQAGSYTPLFNADFMLYFFYGMYIVSGLCLLIVVVYMMLDPERRKKLLKILLRVVPFLILAFFVINSIHSCSDNNGQQLQLQLGLQATPATTSVPQSTFTPNATSTIILVVSILLVLVLAAIILFIIMRSRQEKSTPITPLMRLTDQAQAALDSLHAGGDLKNAVLRCYFEMSRILLEQRSLKRDRAMTPHEFEKFLVASGMPGESVNLLTRLFEEVRYGAKQPGRREEAMAETSLTAIIEACKAAQ